MKWIKVFSLFFFLLAFCFCSKGNDAKVKENYINDVKFDTIYKQMINKSLSYKDRLVFSKMLLKNVDKKNDSLKFLTLNYASYLFGRTNQMDSAIYYTKKITTIYSYQNNNKVKGRVYYKLGNYYSKIHKEDSAFYFYNLSKDLYIKIKDSLQVGNRLRNMAILQSKLGDISGSDSTSIEALKYFGNRNVKARASIYNNLAINARKQSLYKESIYNYKKAINLINKESYRSNLANLYTDLKEYEAAISVLNKLLKDSINSLKIKARVIDNLAYTKWLQNNNTNVFKDLKLANSIKLKQKDNFGLIASYSHLSDYFKEKNKVKALFYADKMYNTAKKAKAIDGLLEAIEKIVTLQTPQKSIKYYQESIYLRDSLKESAINKQYKFAKIKYNYEVEEKQKFKFKTLATQNQLKAEQQNNQKKNVLIVTILSILSLLFLLYRRKQQNRKRVLQETYITETRIAKKLHDELGNDLFNVLTKAQKTNIKTTDIVNDLDKIYLQTRAISHQNDSVETGVDFENYFRSLVVSYTSDTCKIILKDLSSLDLGALDSEKQIVVYRVFNELFVNMKKHSTASLVVLSCKKNKHQLEIIYSDNGIGFKENKIVFKNGLKNMETRIKTINGTINFENKSNKGLKVSIHFKN